MATQKDRVSHMSRARKAQIDRELGEDRPIPRRDFLQGTLIGAAAALTGPLLAGVVGAAENIADSRGMILGR